MSFDTLWEQIVFNVFFYGVQPALAFIKNESFFYWPYVVTFFAISLVVFLWRRDYVAGAFSAKVWWSPSAKADYRYYVINGIVFPATIGAVLWSVPLIGEALSGGLSSIFGEREIGTGSDTAIIVSYTVLYFLFYDFGRFFAHWIQHKWPVLWQFHQVHHSAEVLTPVTSFRVHPIDLVVMSLGETLMAALMYGLYDWLFPGQFGFYVFLGSHVLLVAYRVLGNLRHSHVWLSYGALNRIFVSPAMHQIHHSYLLEHRDTNMGFALSIWDQLFGTAYIPQKREDFPMGLGDGQDDGRWHSVWGMYVEPFKSLWKLLVNDRRRGGARES